MLNAKPHLSESGIAVDWTKLQILEKVLKPLKCLTKQLQAEQYIAGDFLRDLFSCQCALERIIKHEPLYYLEATDMLTVLSRRALDITENIFFAAAIYMDPRYCHSQMRDTFTDEQIIEIEVRVCRTHSNANN